MKQFKFKVRDGKLFSIEGRGWIENWAQDMLYRHDPVQFPERARMEKEILKEMIADDVLGTFFYDMEPFSRPATKQNLIACFSKLRRWESDLIRKFDERKPQVVDDGDYTVEIQERLRVDEYEIRKLV